MLYKETGVMGLSETTWLGKSEAMRKKQNALSERGGFGSVLRSVPRAYWEFEW